MPSEGCVVGLRVLPRDVAAEIITGSIASLGWAVGAATLILAVPTAIETLARADHAMSAAVPVGLLLLMLLSLALVAWRRRVWAVIAYLIVGYVASVSYELLIISALPHALDDQLYLVNRPAVALVLVGLAARTPLIGLAWSALGFAASTAVTLTVSVLGDVPYRPGYGVFLVLVLVLAMYVTLLSVQRVQRRRVPNIDELEAENARLARGEDLARRTVAAVHDTLLNDLSIIMNSPDRLAARALDRLRDDLATLRGAEWLRASSQLTLVDERDSSLRNEIMRMLSDFQWRGITVHVTGNGDGIYQLAPATERAILEALGAALENVVRHSQAAVAEVELVYTPGWVTIMVTDEGVGFDPSVVPADRLGIRASIEARMASIGGTVQIWSSPGAGTSIVLTAPVVSVLRAHEASHHQERDG